MKRFLKLLDYFAYGYIGHSMEKWKTEYYGMYSFSGVLVLAVSPLWFISLIIDAYFCHFSLNFNVLYYILGAISIILVIFINIRYFKDEIIEEIARKWKADQDRKKKWRQIMTYHLIITLIAFIFLGLAVFLFFIDYYMR